MNDAHEQQQTKDNRPAFSVWNGLALVAYVTASILAPLIVIGGVGFLLDWYLGGRRWVFLASAFLAFGVANYLVYRRAQDIARRFK